MKTIGLDFGTESVRGVLVDVETGQEVSTSVADYDHGVIQGKYHDPDDYLTAMWPFMAADLGIRQDTLMAHYLSNHVAVAYGDIFDEMAALSQSLGFRVRVLGVR